MIRDEGDFARHVGYIHHNPVKHGLVTNMSQIRLPGDGRPFHAYVRRGIIAADWSGRDQ
jgi:putative transposase